MKRFGLSLAFLTLAACTSAPPWIEMDEEDSFAEVEDPGDETQLTPAPSMGRYPAAVKREEFKEDPHAIARMQGTWVEDCRPYAPYLTVLPEKSRSATLVLKDGGQGEQQIRWYTSRDCTGNPSATRTRPFVLVKFFSPPADIQATKTSDGEREFILDLGEGETVDAKGLRKPAKAYKRPDADQRKSRHYLLGDTFFTTSLGADEKKAEGKRRAGKGLTPCTDEVIQAPNGLYYCGRFRRK